MRLRTCLLVHPLFVCRLQSARATPTGRRLGIWHKLQNISPRCQPQRWCLQIDHRTPFWSYMSRQLYKELQSTSFNGIAVTNSAKPKNTFSWQRGALYPSNISLLISIAQEVYLKPKIMINLHPHHLHFTWMIVCAHLSQHSSSQAYEAEAFLVGAQESHDAAQQALTQKTHVSHLLLLLDLYVVSSLTDLFIGQVI